MEAASLRTDSLKVGLAAVMADGAVHSGADLAGKFRCSRTTIWKSLRELKSVGLDIESLPGRGYRLARPLELLNQARILESMNPAVRDAIESLVIHPVTESTNECLKSGSAPPPGRSGKGRRSAPGQAAAPAGPGDA